MLIVKCSAIKNDFEDYYDMVADNNETIVAIREDKKNIVIISNEKYNQLEKIARNAEYLTMIDNGIAQLSEGQGQEHELIKIEE